MARLSLIPVDRPNVPPLTVSSRLRAQLVYFATPGESKGAPALGENEYYFLKSEIEQWLEDGLISLVSPLDTANMTEVELEEEQEAFLTWLKKNDLWHVRVSE